MCFRNLSIKSFLAGFVISAAVVASLCYTFFDCLSDHINKGKKAEKADFVFTGKPLVVNIGGPSGSGKTTIARHVLEKLPGKFEIVASYTTRSMRPGEIEGLDYKFISKDKMAELKESNSICEYAEAYENEYGLDCKDVDDVISKGRTPILIMNDQGINAFKALGYNLLSIYLYVDVQTLADRLKNRPGDKSQNPLRLQSAIEEMRAATQIYDVFIPSYSRYATLENVSSLLVASKWFNMKKDLIGKLSNISQDFDSELPKE